MKTLNPASLEPTQSADARAPLRHSPQVIAGALIAAAIVLLVYWPARENGFIWDDLSYLVYSPAYRDPALWFDALFHPPTGQAVFRPLALLSFALPLWAGFTAAATHHLLNMTIHAASVILLTLLAWRIFHAQFARPAAAAACAAITGLVYGLHPALTESVLWIACRFDLLMTFFLLLALLADRRLAGAWARACAPGLLFLCALLCKETAVGFLLAIPLVHLAIEHHPGAPLKLVDVPGIWRRNIAVYAGLFSALAIYLMMRYAILGGSLGLTKVMTRFDEIGSFAQRGIVIAASLTEYIADVLWPSFNVPPNRVLVIPVDDAVRIIPAIAIPAGVLLLAIGAALRSPRASATGLYAAAFLAALLPLSNILPAPTYPGELQTAVRYVTFPLAFICLGICALMPAFADLPAAKKFDARHLIWIPVACWLAGSMVIVRSIIPLWHDEAVFFRWAISLAPPNSLPYLYINLGSYYANHGDMSQARDLFALAVEAQPRSRGVASLAWYNLGNAEEKLGNIERARAVLRGTLVVDPDNVYARVSLSRLERGAGNARAAADLAADGLQRMQRAGMSGSVEAMLHYQLAMALLDMKRFDEAAAHLASASAMTNDPQARAEAEQALARARRQ